MSEQLKSMKDHLMSVAQAQMGNLENVDAKELGEVIDMIKDLDEALYYCAITKAMEERKDEQMNQDKINAAVLASQMQTQNSNYYTPVIYPHYYDSRYYNDPDRMWYDGRDERRGYSSPNNNMGNNETRSYTTPSYVRDFREGRSPMTRRGYMESKELHKDKNTQMSELKAYANDITKDVTEMLTDATPEEKQILHTAFTNLLQKLN